VRVDALERRLAVAEPSVATMLRQRGWQISSFSPRDRLLLPRRRDLASIDSYFEDLRHYYFRRLLQEAAELRVIGPEAQQKLEARWGGRAVAQTFSRLTTYELLSRAADTWVLTAPRNRTFGETLEWFVAQVFTREFAAPAAWGVSVRQIRRGGDFDVVAVVSGRLGYVECKGSPPYNVSAEALARFLDRAHQLASDFAILLLDTTLRIERNIIDNLQSMLTRDPETGQNILHATAGVYEARGARPLFVVTSRRSLIVNLRWCLRRLQEII
jgi:hypothetical protein